METSWEVTVRLEIFCVFVPVGLIHWRANTHTSPEQGHNISHSHDFKGQKEREKGLVHLLVLSAAAAANVAFGLIW